MEWRRCLYFMDLLALRAPDPLFINISEPGALQKAVGQGLRKCLDQEGRPIRVLGHDHRMTTGNRSVCFLASMDPICYSAGFFSIFLLFLR